MSSYKQEVKVQAAAFSFKNYLHISTLQLEITLRLNRLFCLGCTFPRLVAI